MSYLHKTSPDLPAADRCPGRRPTVATSRRPGTSRCTSPRSAPTVLTRDEVAAETVENERRVAEATASEEGKPEAALPKIVEGRVNGFFKENVLLEQPFAKDAKKTVAQGPRGGRRQGHRPSPASASAADPATHHAERPVPFGGRASRVLPYAGLASQPAGIPVRSPPPQNRWQSY